MTPLRDIKFPPLEEEDFDCARIRKEYLRQQCAIACGNLAKNNFHAQWADSIEEARDTVLALVPRDGVVGFGDSHTIFALRLEEGLRQKNCISIPHTCAVNQYAMEHDSPGWKRLGTPEDAKEILRSYLTADAFLLGANAVTVDGQIINIDGTGNRIAGSLYGPGRIIVVAGANKIVPDLAAGLDRIRYVAAQMNNIKYENKLACNLAGTCKECRSEERNCNITCILHKRPVDSDFHVVLVSEELGF